MSVSPKLDDIKSYEDDEAEDENRLTRKKLCIGLLLAFCCCGIILASFSVIGVGAYLGYNKVMLAMTTSSIQSNSTATNFNFTTVTTMLTVNTSTTTTNTTTNNTTLPAITTLTSLTVSPTITTLTTATTSPATITSTTLTMTTTSSIMTTTATTTSISTTSTAITTATTATTTAATSTATTLITTTKVPTLLDSTILDYVNAQKLFVLAGFPLTTNLTILYRATRDGFGVADFNRKCSNIAPTLTIIRNTLGWIFGGYTVKPWLTTNSSYQQSDPNAFVYSLNNSIRANVSAAGGGIVVGPCCGPTFGGNPSDIYISDMSHMNNFSDSNFGKTYRLPNGVSAGHNATHSLLSGTYKFITTEIEVFRIH